MGLSVDIDKHLMKKGGNVDVRRKRVNEGTQGDLSS